MSQTVNRPPVSGKEELSEISEREKVTFMKALYNYTAPSRYCCWRMLTHLNQFILSDLILTRFNGKDRFMFPSQRKGRKRNRVTCIGRLGVPGYTSRVRKCQLEVGCFSPGQMSVSVE